MIMRLFLVVLITFMIGCNAVDEKKENTLMGNWQFIDLRGNYIEALFEDSTYFVYNISMGGPSPKWNYFVRNDSLCSILDPKRPDMYKKSEITWLDNDKVIVKSQYSSDTMDRIKDSEITLQNTDLKRDSANFRGAFSQRLEDYLLLKGILSPEEVKEFKENKVVPEDILRQ